MACFPKIDRPCPLSRAEQAGVGGHCAHCDHAVHHLDGLDSEARRALVRNAGGPLCVAYRVPMAAAALALSLALPVAAQENAGLPPASDEAPIIATAGAEGPVSPVTSPEAEPPECEEALEEMLMVMGGISATDAAQWLDEADSELPEIPIVSEPDR